MKIGIALCFVCCCFLSFTSSAKMSGQPLVDSLQKQLKNTLPDSTRLYILYKISFEYSYLDPNKGLSVSQEVMQLGEKIHSKIWMAKSVFLTGCNYDGLADYPKALEYYSRSLEQFQSLHETNLAGLAMMNIGTVMVYSNNYPKGLEYYLRALKIFEELQNKVEIAQVSGNIGNIFFAKKDFEKALRYYQYDLKVNLELNDQLGVANVTQNLGTLYAEQGDHIKAINEFRKCLVIAQSNSFGSFVAGLYYSIAAEYNFLKEFDSAIVNVENGLNIYKTGEAKDNTILARLKLAYGESFLGKVLSSSNTNREDADKVLLNTTQSGQLATAIDYLEQSRQIAEVINVSELSIPLYRGLATAYHLNNNPQKAFAFQRKLAAIMDTFYSKDNDEKIVRMSMQYDFDKKTLSDSLKTVAMEKEHRQAFLLQRSYTYTGIGAAILLLCFSFFMARNNRLLDKEKQRSDNLLLNILPAEVAEELKNKGSSDARLFDEVTVLFTDFVGFTHVSERLEPKELIAELDTCFKAFDGIISRYGIEKIKTIGDAYLAVCGLPNPDANHAENTVRAALEIADFMESRFATLGERTFQVRIGIHSGPVVAGIVGVKKFAYDIWGDTVNTAARMEQNSLPGKVNISEVTSKLVMNQFSCHYRGEIPAKNKGMLKMYFVG